MKISFNIFIGFIFSIISINAFAETQLEYIYCNSLERPIQFVVEKEIGKEVPIRAIFLILDDQGRPKFKNEVDVSSLVANGSEISLKGNVLNFDDGGLNFSIDTSYAYTDLVQTRSGEQKESQTFTGQLLLTYSDKKTEKDVIACFIGE